MARPRPLTLLLICSLLAVAASPRTTEQQNPAQASALPAVDHGGLITTHLEAIESFFRLQVPRFFGVAFNPVDGAVPYRTSDPTSLPLCNGTVFRSDFLSENAFYCERENVIIFDEELLIPVLRAEYGELAVGVLFAHEYAHAVQAHVGIDADPLAAELQADCFAGAWAGTQQTGHPVSESVRIAFVLESLTEFADPPGSSDQDNRAHGVASDRVLAFTTGMNTGITTCI